MALFGAPIAHEDHAQRACYAALHLRDELRAYASELRAPHGLDFSVRMGLNSGEVVVGKIGDDLRMDYTAQGHTVGLAQRMEQLAEPGTVYLTEHTARAGRGLLRARGLGPIAVKGVAASRSRSSSSRGSGRCAPASTSRAPAALTRFVGRERRDGGARGGARARARAAAARSSASSPRRARARAGCATSSSSAAARAACRARGTRRRARQERSRCLPMLRAVPRLLRHHRARQTTRRAREKIAGRLLLLDEGFREVLPLVFEFFGVPDPANPPPRMDPEARQRQLVGVLRGSCTTRRRRATR